MTKINLSNSLLVACLSFAFAACQNDQLADQNPSPLSTDYVRFSSGQPTARVNGQKQKYIVVLRQDVDVTTLDGETDYDKRSTKMRGVINNIVSGKFADRAEEVYSKALKGFSIRLDADEVNALRNSPYVASVEPDQMIILRKPTTTTPTEPSTQETPWGISRVGGAVSYTGTNVAWVVDTGIDLDHADLNVDANRGRNFVGGTSADDDHGHGTHVAGTIAARNNTVGVVGVAAGAKVVPIKVLDGSGSGSTSGIISALDYIASVGRAGDVINMSLGGGVSSSLDNAVLNTAARGFFLALAAGNESQSATNVSPGRVNGTNIYTISAFDSNNLFASFSNFGNPPIDYAAPGVSIKSTYPGGSYAFMSGTSMATPHMAGVLLATGGRPRAIGPVSGDPDGNADQMVAR
ncbi:hypothetical protein GCM10023189_48930 [Nibrella saemangeumensis]|uniref:Peptidase inhibitor I9 n=1 Tax=Nibrella saemangeumensis TaxID=1084526 RepID=A0ABP8NJJ1_9BACT